MVGLSLSLILSGSTNVLLAILIIYTRQNKNALEEAATEREQLEETQSQLQNRIDRHELLIDSNAADLEDVHTATERNDARIRQMRRERAAERGHVNGWEHDGQQDDTPNDPPS